FLSGRYPSPGRGVSALEALSAEALELVLRHPWAGNFRELDNFASRLPEDARRGSVDARVARAALDEGVARPLGGVEAREGERGGAGPAGFRELLRAACAAYEEDHQGGGPERLGDVKGFVDGYLKPLFVAHGCGLQGLEALTGELNYS